MCLRVTVNKQVCNDRVNTIHNASKKYAKILNQCTESRMATCLGMDSNLMNLKAYTRTIEYD